MQLAIVLYPRFTALDAAGPHEVLGRLPDTETVFVSAQGGPVTNDFESMTVMTKALDEVPAPDIVLVPGGPGQGEQMEDGPLHRWLRKVDETTTWTTSVCTGALILAGAGVLNGRRATTHWLAFEEFDGLGVTPVRERVVMDGKYVTGAGVSAGIDMALTLAGIVAGDEYAKTLQLGLEYAPEPPYDAGSPEAAPRAIVKEFTDNRPQALWGRA
ncbi:MAG: DJ-1/PfpI family protein [Actinobacteria bacterium]|nr:DJ-1/PfpI family protein [Actinomycetota bacterium]